MALKRYICIYISEESVYENGKGWVTRLVWPFSGALADWIAVNCLFLCHNLFVFFRAQRQAG